MSTPNLLKTMVLLIAAFPFQAIGQTKQAPTKTEVTAAYSQAIAEYIKAVDQRDHKHTDTLLLGKNPDFPDIKLPPVIEHTSILLLTTKEVDKKRKYNKHLVFVNVAGNVTNDVSDFLFITFYPGYVHQYDCTIDLKYDAMQKAYQLVGSRFKNYAY